MSNNGLLKHLVLISILGFFWMGMNDSHSTNPLDIVYWGISYPSIGFGWLVGGSAILLIGAGMAFVAKLFSKQVAFSTWWLRFSYGLVALVFIGLIAN